MSDLYWITVLGNLGTLAVVVTMLTTISSILLLIPYLESYENENHRVFKIALYVSVFLLVISTTMNVLIPSRKELYVIYGLGGTIDYLKDNKEAKKLPDNVLKSLNIFIEEYIKKQKK